jgi:hypothetical protein
VDLTNPGRFPKTSGWSLASGRRPSTSTNPADTDYWWQVTGSNQDEILTIPTWAPPNPVANCMLSFSTEWAPASGFSERLLLERNQGGVWNVVTEWSLATPFPETRREIRLRTYTFEANAQLPLRTPEFRFRLPANQVSSIKIFDPVVLCRTGGMP